MDKKFTVVIIVVLLNSFVMLVGFGYLHNEIDELKTEESDLPETPTPTEPEQMPEYEPEPTPAPEEEAQPTPEPEPEPEPQQPSEPEPTEPTHKMDAPEANLTVVSWVFHGNPNGGDGGTFEAKVEGTILNPNNSLLYAVEISLTFDIGQWRTAMPLGFYSEHRTISVGTLRSNQSIAIDETFGFAVLDWSSLELNSFKYVVENWDE